MRKDQAGSGLGSVSVVPGGRPIVVGRRFWIDVTYTAGPKGVEPGGTIRFKVPGLLVKPQEQGPVSCSNPDVEWVCSNHLPKVNGKDGSEFFTINYLFVTICKAALKEGDSITVRYAVRKASIPEWAQTWPVEVAVDVDGSRPAPGSGFYLVEEVPALRFVNDRPWRMEAFVPSYACAGESLTATVRMLDRNSNIVEDYTGTVMLEAHGPGDTIDLGEHGFGPQHKGVLAVETDGLETPGVYRLWARDKALGICARSNPVKVTQEQPAHRLFWGDTHCHSSISADTAAVNATVRRPAGNYEYARDRAALDFCVVTDHIEDQSDQDWEETRRAARDAYEPGKFVSFSGFEATYKPLRREGDKNVYFLDDDQPWVNEGTTQGLYAELKRRGSKVMVIPHLHCLTNWERHDPEVERVVEVYSHWGCGLSLESDPPITPGKPRPRASYVHHALEQGARLGFIASADHSYGHPGDDFWWPLSNYNGGLAAVYAPELTRRGIWNALWARRCYGTTRARILLEFAVDGHVMGEELTDNGGPRSLIVNVHGTSAIEVAEVVKNGRVLARFSGDRKIDLEVAFQDAQPERDTDYYYVHVQQEDGEQAWCSPVWVKQPE